MSGTPGTTNFTNYLNKRLLILLRDGRKLFGNIILEDVIERIYVELEFADQAIGSFIVRGENVVLVGELDEEEFKAVNRRMNKFKRPLEQLQPIYLAMRMQEQQRKHWEMMEGHSEMAEFDYY